MCNTHTHGTIGGGTNVATIGVSSQSTALPTKKVVSIGAGDEMGGPATKQWLSLFMQDKSQDDEIKSLIKSTIPQSLYCVLADYVTMKKAHEMSKLYQGGNSQQAEIIKEELAQILSNLSQELL